MTTVTITAEIPTVMETTTTTSNSSTTSIDYSNEYVH